MACSGRVVVEPMPGDADTVQGTCTCGWRTECTWEDAPELARADVRTAVLAHLGG